MKCSSDLRLLDVHAGVDLLLRFGPERGLHRAGWRRGRAAQQRSTTDEHPAVLRMANNQLV